MYQYRYIVVVDFDEVIVPKGPGNYSDLLKAIHNSNKVRIFIHGISRVTLMTMIIEHLFDNIRHSMVMTHCLLVLYLRISFLRSFGTADALAPNPHQGIICVNAN